MFGFIGGIPTRLKHIFSKFKRFLTKPQYKNFCRTELGLIAAGKKEHDIKSINELFIDKKDQSSLNRFFTQPQWDILAVANQGRELFLSEQQLDSQVEYQLFDDSVVKKYSQKTEMTCYNHSTTMGTVLSHDYVTSVYVNNGCAVTEGTRLYGNEKKCRQKGVEFKTKVQLACELMSEHVSHAKQAIDLWDSWFMCKEMVEASKKHGHNWIGEIKSNRIVFYEGKKYHVCDLADKLRSEGSICDVLVGGELFQACKVEVFLPKIGYVSIVVDVKSDTRDVHFLCTDLVGLSVEEVVGHVLNRHYVEDSYKLAKTLGLGEYRFRESEAALIHAHLVFLACTLLDMLRRRLLRYSVVGRLLSFEETVEWVRRKAMHLFLHRVKEANGPFRNILMMINTK
jgi:hypothetical protein